MNDRISAERMFDLFRVLAVTYGLSFGIEEVEDGAAKGNLKIYVGGWHWFIPAFTAEHLLEAYVELKPRVDRMMREELRLRKST